MPHPAGIITYVPNDTFRVPRGYVNKLWVHTNHVNVPHFADNLITWTHDPPDTVLGYTKLRDRFCDWTSNAYALNYLVEWWYYTIGTGGPEYEWGGELSFAYSPAQKVNCLVVATAAADRDYYFTLPPAPSDYWLNLP